jgi:hypothetical protein
LKTSKWIQWFIGLADAEKGTNTTSKELVVWGTILSSTIGLSKTPILVRNMMELPPYQYSVVIGLLLSDGWLI